MQVKQILLGESPKTTIIGYILAGLYAFQQYFRQDSKWYEWLVPVLIAIFSRLVSEKEK